MKYNRVIPDPLDTDHQYYRFHHLDLPNLDETELEDELNTLKPLLWGIPMCHWLRDRVLHLKAELRRRQAVDSERWRRQTSKPTGVIPL